MSEQEAHIDSAGARLRVLERGDPIGRPLLFLHGGMGTVHDWDPLLDAFADCRCVLLDTRGHGGSTLGAAPLRYPSLARDAAGVIEALTLERPIVIGHSDGGITGVHLAADGTPPLGGLVTIGIHVDPPDPDILKTIYRPLTPDKWRAKFPDGVALYEQLNPEPDFASFFDQLADMWRDTDPGNYPGDRAREIACPVLAIGGDADHLVPRANTLDFVARVPQAELGIVPGGSHVVAQEQPALIAGWIRRFLERI